jgi:uncharacterized membrane protein
MATLDKYYTNGGIRMKQKKYNIFVDIICLILLIGVMIYLLLTWRSIPDRIPGHYNAAGEINRMGGKGELFATPIIGLLMYIGMTVIERFPQVWNTGVTVTKDNKERVYQVIRNMMSTLKLIVVVIFTYLPINSSHATPLPVWFTPAYVILLFGTLIFFIIKLVKVSK